MASRYSLKLKTLKFISAVDTPAQETATAVLFKSKDAPAAISASAKVVKTSDELGLVFGWALTSVSKGESYFDLHGDSISEEDLVAVAASFLADGGNTDEMHDREADGKVVFMMPLTAEVAKAFGIETTTTGLMIAIKPSPEVFAKFKAKELLGFSIDGTGIRTELPAATQKRAALTTATAGHTHLLSCLDEMQSGTTSGERLPKADGYLGDYYDGWHSHPWVRNDEKQIVIGEAMGHTHEVSTTTAAIKAHVAVKSSPSNDARSVDSMKPVVLTESQFAHYKTLSDADGEAFLAKSFHDRESDVTKAAAADPIVFTGTLTGVEVRKSHGDLAHRLAKQGEEQANLLKAAQSTIAIEKAAREAVELRKRATDLFGHIAGTDDEHAELLGLIETMPVEKQAKLIAVVKAANAANVAAGKPAGFGGATSPSTPEDATVALEKGLFAFCKAQSITKNLWTDGLDAFVATPEGEALKAAYDESLAG